MAMAAMAAATATTQQPQSIGGFALLPAPGRRHRLVVSVAGLDKSGKTNFALTSPGPIAYANFDTGLEGVVDKFRKDGKQVYSNDYRVVLPPGVSDPTAVSAIGNKMWEEYKADVRAALKSPLIRTIVTDTESETWELVRIARFGKLAQVMPHHYGPVNAEYRNFMNEVYDTDKNLVLLGRMKDEWENTVNAQGKEVGRKTGKLERVGMKDIPYIVQLNAIARFDPFAEDGNRFSLEIVNCRQNSSLCGLVLPQDLCTFAQIASLVYMDSDEREWQ